MIWRTSQDLQVMKKRRMIVYNGMTDGSIEWRNQAILPQFTGYDHALLHQESQIVAAETITKGKKSELVVAIDPCPFYGLGGGQVPDTGFITLANGSQWKVTDVFQPYEGGIALKLASPKGSKEMQKQLEEDQEFLQVRVSHHDLANGSRMLFFAGWQLGANRD